MNKYLSFFLPLAALLLLTGCAASPAADDAVPAVSLPEEAPFAASQEIGPQRLDLSVPAALPGVTYNDGVFTVEAAGTYQVSGSLRGRLAVDADGPVELLLAGANITGPECLKILSGDPVTITLAAGTNNSLSDGASGPDGHVRAAVYSKAPLIVQGEGILSVNARANNGIQSKDSLTVAGGTVVVSAGNNGLKAVGELSVTGGKLRIFSGGDGIAAKASRVREGRVYLSGGDVTIQAEARGIDAEGTAEIAGGLLRIQSDSDGLRADFVDIRGGGLTIDAQADGVQAATLLYIEDGALDIRAGGGGGAAIRHPGESFGPWSQSRTQTEATASAKGLKSDGSIHIAGGTIALDTADDSIHCGAVCTIDGGEIAVLSSDDGVHADDMLVVNDGTIRIDDCFEGLEAFAIEVHGGDIVIRAVNDGINANGAEMMFFRPNAGQEAEISSASGSSTSYFRQTGGVIDLVVTGNMSNQGDGVDSNGTMYIEGGVLTVSTYGSFMENGLDTGWGGPVVTGGMVMAGGSSAMAEGFSSYSTQCCAVVATSYMPDGTEVTITDEDGNLIWAVTMADAFSCLQVSHPGMTVGHVYTLAYGSQSTTLDFTSTNIIRSTGGFGGPGRPF